MRRLRSLPLALAGLAIVAPASARAGFPLLGSTDGGQVKVRQVRREATAPPSAPYLCADCQARMMAESGGPAPVVISGAPTAVMASSAPCSACAMTAGEGASMPMTITPSAPGYASIGDGPASVLASASSPAPGYATVGGGMVASSEPAPIGVVRTSYASQPEPGSLGASVAPTMPGRTPTVGQLPYARPDEVPPSLYGPQAPRRHRFLSRIIGLPQMGQMRAQSQARARENHAMTSYGTAAAPEALPASMVYGR